MGLANACLPFEGHPKASPVKGVEWRGHPDGEVVPRLSPFFMKQLSENMPLQSSLRVKKESGNITYYEGGVVGKLVFSADYVDLGRGILEAGLGHRVPYLGYFENGPRITMLSIEIAGFDLQSALAYKNNGLSANELQMLWFEQGLLDGEFARKGVRINLGSNECRIRNYMTEKPGGDFGLLQYIDLDTRCTKVQTAVSKDEREKDLFSHLLRVGTYMGETDYTEFIRGYVTGLLGRVAKVSEKVVSDAIYNFRLARARSPEWINDCYTNLGKLGF
jgi:hypothetical protein